MLAVDIKEVEKSFYSLAKKAMEGEKVIICRDNVPLLELALIAPQKKNKRQ